MPENIKSSWHIYHLKVEKRDELIAFLKQNDIAPGVHYYPLHMHTFYKDTQANCPIAEQVWEKIISLPLYPDMSQEDISKIIDTVKRFGREKL